MAEDGAKVHLLNETSRATCGTKWVSGLLLAGNAKDVTCTSCLDIAKKEK